MQLPCQVGRTQLHLSYEQPSSFLRNRTSTIGDRLSTGRLRAKRPFRAKSGGLFLGTLPPGIQSFVNSRGEICAARGLQTVLEGTVRIGGPPRSGLKTSNTTTAGLSRMALVKPLLLRVTSQTTSNLSPRLNCFPNTIATPTRMKSRERSEMRKDSADSKRALIYLADWTSVPAQSYRLRMMTPSIEMGCRRS